MANIDDKGNGGRGGSNNSALYLIVGVLVGIVLLVSWFMYAGSADAAIRTSAAAELDSPSDHETVRAAPVR